MDNESTSRLKFDKRLANRRGWVEPAEFEQELASLPDVADKILPVSDEPPAQAKAPVAPETGSEGGTPDA